MVLKELRIKKGLLQREVAKELGIATTTYLSYEKGINEPSISMLFKLADFFGVTIDELLGRETAPGLFDNARVPKPRVQELFDKLNVVDQGRILGRMEEMIESYGATGNSEAYSRHKASDRN